MNKKGVTLLLAVLVSSIALSIGIGIFSLLFSEIEISGSAKDSITAFYAADSGAECAIYWELLENKGYLTRLSGSASPFATDASTPPLTHFADGTTLTSIICNGVPYPRPSDPYANFGAGHCANGDINCTADFFLEYSDSGVSCAHVTVEKENIGGIIQTRIISGGENRNQCDVLPTSSKTLQQGVEYIL